jgi:hypothetical protein
MQYRRISEGLTVRKPDPRFEIDLPANLVVSDDAPLPVRIINLSRHGFRVALDRRFPAGETVRLEVDGWPRLVARVIWSENGRTGCSFIVPPDPKIFAMMSTAVTGEDRASF